MFFNEELVFHLGERATKPGGFSHFLKEATPTMCHQPSLSLCFPESLRILFLVYYLKVSSSLEFAPLFQAKINTYTRIATHSGALVCFYSGFREAKSLTRSHSLF